MATRNITDCQVILSNAYSKALAQWAQQHADKSVPFVDCAYRSPQEQQSTFNQGRITKGIVVTWARPGESPHNYLPSYAFDIAFKKADGSLDWTPTLFVLFWQIISAIEPNIEWGGNFPNPKEDRPHFEVKNWTALIQKKAVV